MENLEGISFLFASQYTENNYNKAKQKNCYKQRTENNHNECRNIVFCQKSCKIYNRPNKEANYYEIAKYRENVSPQFFFRIFMFLHNGTIERKG